MKKNKLFLALIVGACCFGAHMPNLEAYQRSTTGEKVDDAIDNAKDKIDKAKEKTKDGIDKAKEKTKKGIDKLKEKIKD